MVSIKVLVVLSLIAAASCSPTFPLLKKHHHGKGGLSIGGGISASLNSLFRGLRTHVRVADDILESLVKWKVADFNAVVRLSIRLTVAFGGVIDLLIPGLGNLAARIIVVTLRIILCLVGSITGGKPYLCSQSKFPNLKVDGAVSTDIDGLIGQFGCQNARGQVDKYINDFTDGKGIDSLSGSRKVVLQIILELAIRLDGRKFSKSDFNDIIVKIAIISGSIGNSYKSGLGDNIIDGLLSSINGKIKLRGFPDILGLSGSIKKRIAVGKDDDAPWNKRSVGAGGDDDDDDDDDDDNKVSVNLNVDFLNSIKLFLTKARKHLRIGSNITQYLRGLKVFVNFNDVLVFALRLVQAFASIINRLVAGLGDLVSRIFLVLVKIIVCINGKGNHGICRSDFSVDFKVKGDASTADDLVKQFGLDGAVNQVNVLINKKSKKGLKGLRVSVRAVAQVALDLAKLLDNRSNLKNTDLGVIYYKISIIFGTVGNRYGKGLGRNILIGFINSVSDLIKKNNYGDVKSKQDEVIKVVDNTPSDDNDDSNDDDNNGDNDNNGSTGGKVQVSLKLTSALDRLFKGLGSRLNISVDIRNYLTGLKVISSFDEVITFTLRLVRSFGAAINIIFRGLGDIVSRLYVVLVKIVLCLRGSNGKNIGFCSRDWTPVFGVKGDATNVGDLVKQFQLVNCKDQILTRINKRTKGQGLKGLKSSQRVIVQAIIDLADLLDTRGDKLSAKDLSNIYVRISVLIGAVGNNYSNGLGVDVSIGFIDAVNGFLTKNGYDDIKNKQDDVKKQISVVVEDKGSWDNNDNGDDNDDNDNGNNGNNGNNDNGNNGNSGVDVKINIPGILTNALDTLFKGLGGRLRISADIRKYLLGLRVITKFDDVFTFALRLVQSFASAINIIVKGLGDLVSRIFVVLVRIVVCLLGSKKNVGFCSRDWTPVFGVKGDATDVATLIKQFGLDNVVNQINVLINTRTRGKGIKSLRPAQRAIVQACIDLGSLLDNRSSLSAKSLSTIYLRISVVIGLVGNTYGKNVGTNISISFIDSVNVFLTKNGYDDIKSKKDDVNKQIDVKDDKDSWNNGGDNDNKGNDNNSGNDNKGNDNNNDNKGNDNNSGNDNKGNDNKGNDNNSGNDNKGNDNKGNDNNSGNDNKGNDNNNDNKGNDNKGNDNNTGNDNKGNDNKGNDNNSGNDNKGNDNKGNDNNSGNDNKGNDNKGNDNNTGNDNKGNDNDNNNNGNDNKGNDNNSGNDNKGNDNNNNSGNDNNNNSGNDKNVKVDVSDKLTKSIDVIFKGIGKKVKLGSGILKSLLSIKVVNNLDDVLVFALRLVQSFGAAINVIISGLGDLVVKIYIVLSKIIVCFLGSNKIGFCSRDWTPEIGVKGDANNADDLVKQCGLENAKDLVLSLVNKKTGGKGVDALNGNQKVLVNAILSLAVSLDGRASLSTKDIGSLYVQISIVFGSVGNSYTKGLGTNIVSSFIQVIRVYLSRFGYDISSQVDDINNKITSVQEEKQTWVSGDDGSDDNQGGSTTTVTVTLQSLFNDLGQKTHISSDVYSSLVSSSETLYAGLDGVVGYGLKLGQGLGVLLDLLAPGLGALISKIIVVLSKIIVCFVASTKDIGVCSDDLTKDYGIAGDASSAQALIDQFKLANAKQQVQGYIDSFTNNKGISSVPEGQQVILQACLNIGGLLDGYASLSQENLTDLYVEVLTIFGSIANSYSEGLGDAIVEGVVAYYSKFLNVDGYVDIAPRKATIVNNISKSNNDKSVRYVFTVTTENQS